MSIALLLENIELGQNILSGASKATIAHLKENFPMSYVMGNDLILVGRTHDTHYGGSIKVVSKSLIEETARKNMGTDVGSDLDVNVALDFVRRFGDCPYIPVISVFDIEASSFALDTLVRAGMNQESLEGPTKDADIEYLDWLAYSQGDDALEEEVVNRIQSDTPVQLIRSIVVSVIKKIEGNSDDPDEVKTTPVEFIVEHANDEVAKLEDTDYSAKIVSPDEWDF